MTTETDKEELEALRQHVAEQGRVLAELEAKLAKLTAPPPKPEKREPWPGPRDWTAGMSMPASALAAMVACVPDRLMAEIVRDSRPSAPSSIIPAAPTAAVTEDRPRGDGWVRPRPLEPPPGMSGVDAVAAHFDAVDRAENARRLLAAGMAKPEAK